ncbi:DUF418 domain-containing protein [Paenibacillus sp. SI8]|uniref:DUF418 domain-containing protein n=1 Tax=unclassified Paenibacillus TaxID=185978 RepID=UPI003464EAA2
MNSTLLPIAKEQRLTNIDALRGIAVCGILFANNIWEFSHPMLGHYSTWMILHNAWNLGAFHMLDLIFLGHFRTIFSFLFGFSMVIMMNRIQAKNQPFLPFYIKRLSTLAILGFAHAVLIWDGDILVEYAVVGFVMLFFRNRSVKFLISMAFLLLFIFGSLAIIPELNPPPAQSTFKAELSGKEKYEKTKLLYTSGSYKEITEARVSNWELSGTSVLAGTLAMFLFGIAFAKSGVLHDSESHVRFWKKVCLGSFLTGVPLLVMNHYLALELYRGQEVTQGLYYIIRRARQYISDPAICFFYISGFVLLTRHAWWKKLIKPFEYMGKMAFTNYLMQSILLTTLFYGYGLGLFDKFNMVFCYLIAIALIITQMAASRLWLKYFLYGPFEWLWRSITYSKILQIRNHSNHI